jgi:hypothetical protein
MRAGFLFKEVRIGLRRNLTMTFAVVVTVAISLSLLGIGLLSNAQVNAMKDYWYDKIEVSVFLCGTLSESPTCANGVVTPEQRASIKTDLEALPVVQSVFYESQTEAFARFKERFKNSAIAQNVTADQLPESFRVKLKDPTQFDVVVSAFSGRPGVDIVQDQRTILEKFFKLLDVLRNGALLVGLFSVLTAALLISNTLRIAAFNPPPPNWCDEARWCKLLVNPTSILIGRCYLCNYWLGIGDRITCWLKDSNRFQRCSASNLYQVLWLGRGLDCIGLSTSHRLSCFNPGFGNHPSPLSEGLIRTNLAALIDR